MPLVMSEGPSPFFSVIICTFNRAQLLPRALDSLLAQTERSWEAIVVDDGSQDDTYQVVRPYVDANPNFRYILHANRGLSPARNIGIAAAAGDYVTFLDSDDWYLPDHLASRRRVLAEHPGVELVHGGCQIIGNPYVVDKHDPNRMLDLHDLVVGGTFVMPKATALAFGGFPISYSNDGDLFETLQAAGCKIVRTQHPTYIYDRTTPDSLLHIVADGGYEAIQEYRRLGSWNSPRAHMQPETGD